MTDRAHEIEQEAAELEAFTRNEMASEVRDSRAKVVEAVLFLAQVMGEEPSGGRSEECSQHVAELATAALYLEHVAVSIEQHDERQAFTRRALADGVGKSA